MRRKKKYTDALSCIFWLCLSNYAEHNNDIFYRNYFFYFLTSRKCDEKTLYEIGHLVNKKFREKKFNKFIM